MISILLLTFFSIFALAGEQSASVFMCDLVVILHRPVMLFIVSYALGSVYMDGIRFCIGICLFVSQWNCLYLHHKLSDCKWALKIATNVLIRFWFLESLLSRERRVILILP